MKKWTKLIALTLLAAVFLTACGGKSPQNGGAYYPSDMETAGGSFYYDEAYDYAPMEVPAPDPVYNSEGKPANSADGKQAGLILTFSANVDIETLDFEQSMQAIRSAIEACGGYISSQRQNGGYTNYGGYYVTQSVDMQIKVPADRFQEFLNGTAQFGNVTSVNSWQEDITGAYMDTKARLESLESQRQRLMAMMDQAETVSDLIQIEAQLSETIYQIESYTSQMKIYQGLADYSTIDISLREVSVVTSNPQTFGERIIETFKRTGRNFVDTCEDLVLTLIELLPGLIILAVIVLVIVRVVKARKARKQREYEAWIEEQQKLQAHAQAQPNTPADPQ
jgi:hypothetical protein